MPKYRMKFKDTDNKPKLFLVKTNVMWGNGYNSEKEDYIVAKDITSAKKHWQNVNNNPLADKDIKEVADKEMKKVIEKGLFGYDAINNFNKSKKFKLSTLIKDSKFQDRSHFLEDLNYKSIYTVDYTVTNKDGDKDRISEKVLALDYEDARQIIIDSYEDDVEIEFSKYNPISIKDMENFIIEALDAEHIYRRE